MSNFVEQASQVREWPKYVADNAFTNNQLQEMF